MAVFRADGGDYDSLNAGADLSAKLYYAAHMDTDGDLVLAGAGEPVYGIITEGAVSGSPVTVQVAGIAKAIAGGSFDAGVLLEADTNGKLVSASGAGSNIVGIARNSSGGANEIVSVALGGGQLGA